MSVKKGVEKLVVFVMTDTAGMPKPGAAIAAQVSKAGGAFADSGNGVEEMGGGFYKLLLAASEMNAGVVALKLTAPGCEQQNLVFYTTVPGDYKADVSKLDVAVSTRAPEAGGKIAAIKAKTDTISWADVELISKVEQGRWKIENNQMIFYDNTNGEPLLVFNLKGKDGQPTEENVHERVPA